MICFKDKTFCSASQVDCVNDKCRRYFGPKEQAEADAWWKRFNAPSDPDHGPPISLSNMKKGCAIYKRKPR
jgi:hypothetical protein